MGDGRLRVVVLCCVGEFVLAFFGISSLEKLTVREDILKKKTTKDDLLLVRQCLTIVRQRLTIVRQRLTIVRQRLTNK